MVKVLIRNNETGEERTYVAEESFDYAYRYSCNRHIYFEWAAGNKPDPDIKCGTDKFTIPYIELESGERVLIDDRVFTQDG